ncbi:MAG: hypothetical protein ABSD96_21280 [Candidatus Korobacteraceae bacterium]
MTFQPYWLSLLSPVILRWMLLRAETAKAKRKPGMVVFPASGLALLCLGSLVLACCIVIGGWQQDARWMTTSVGLVWAAVSLWIWPTTIVLNSTSLTAKHIWRPTRSIPYSEIEYVSRMEDRQAIVYGNGKVREIRISEFHVGDDELEAELKKRGVKYYKF